MSTYYTVQGRIQFTDEDTYEECCDILRGAGVLPEKGSGDEKPMTADDDALEINIPHNAYRNFFRVPDEAYMQAANYGFVWTSTDGHFIGGYVTPDDRQDFQLEEWGVNNGFDDAPNGESAEDFDAYVDWQSDIEQAFFDEFVRVIPE